MTETTKNKVTFAGGDFTYVAETLLDCVQILTDNVQYDDEDEDEEGNPILSLEAETLERCLRILEAMGFEE